MELSSAIESERSPCLSEADRASSIRMTLLRQSDGMVLLSLALGGSGRRLVGTTPVQGVDSSLCISNLLYIE
jgi:hypothetical protein